MVAIIAAVQVAPVRYGSWERSLVFGPSLAGFGAWCCWLNCDHQPVPLSYFIMFLLGLFCVVVWGCCGFCQTQKNVRRNNRHWHRKEHVDPWNCITYQEISSHNMHDLQRHIFHSSVTAFGWTFAQIWHPDTHTHTHTTHTHHTSHLTKAHEILYTSLTLRFIIILSLPLPTTFAMCFTFNQINHPYPTPWSMSLTEKEFGETRYFRRRNIDQCTFFSRT